MVNFGHVRTAADTASGQSRLEFRLRDSSVQPGRVQAQINISLAMAAFALHHDTPGDTPAAERAPATPESATGTGGSPKPILTTPAPRTAAGSTGLRRSGK